MAGTGSTALVITRTIQADLDRVWACWTEREQLAQWWGPKGMKLEIARHELRPGGLFVYAMHLPNGDIWWGRIEYRRIEAPVRLEYIVSFCDETGVRQRNPLAPTWPLDMLSVLEFTGRDGSTELTMTVSPEDASPDEIATFQAGFDSMRGGFGATMDMLAQHIQASALEQ